MNKDRAEGKIKDIAGRAKRQVGEWTGDSEAQAKGAAKQVEGKVQNACGKAKDAVKSNENVKGSERGDEALDADDEESTPRQRAS